MTRTARKLAQTGRHDLLTDAETVALRCDTRARLAAQRGDVEREQSWRNWQAVALARLDRVS